MKSAKYFGMGTELQCESYPLGYHSMRNLNNNSNSSYSQFNEDKGPKEHFCNSFMLRPVDGYSGYDIEMLKRTMLEHEAVFRKQVCELHRLYRTQKDLMVELKRQESYEFPSGMRTSQSYWFSSPTASSESREKLWQLSIIPPTSDNFSNFNPKGVSQRMFDLQLPAVVHVEADDSERIEPLSSSRDNSLLICDDKCEADLKLTLGTSDYVNRSVSNGLLNGRAEHEDTNGHQSLTRSNASFLTKDFFTDKHRDEWDHSNFFNGDNAESRQEWSPFNYNDGRKGNRVNSLNLDLSIEKLPLPSESPEEQTIKTSHRISSPDCSEMHTWIEEKPTLSSIDIEVLSRKKSQVVTHIPIAVQALPCFLPSKLSKLSKDASFFNQSLGDFPSPHIKKSKKQGSGTRVKQRTVINLNSRDNTAAGESEVPSNTAAAIHEKIERLAAENLMAISQDRNQNHHHHHVASSYFYSFGSLIWFAEVSLSKAAESDDCDDLFESLTLKLEELNPSEYLTPLKDLNNNPAGNSSLLLPKTHRAQAKRRQQRKKDFQKDILPGLVSLSKHQVREDFQAFECVMRAMGEAWPCCKLTKRSNGRRYRYRKEKKSRHPLMEGGEAPHLKVEVDQKSMLRWGRTTRRGRRVRLKPGNVCFFSFLFPLK